MRYYTKYDMLLKKRNLRGAFYKFKVLAVAFRGIIVPFNFCVIYISDNNKIG